MATGATRAGAGAIGAGAGFSGVDGERSVGSDGGGSNRCTEGHMSGAGGGDGGTGGGACGGGVADTGGGVEQARTAWRRKSDAVSAIYRRPSKHPKWPNTDVAFSSDDEA